MAEKITLEDQVKTLQRQFGGLVKLVKDLKTSVEALEKKTVPNKQDEVKEIMETQRVIEEVLVANSDAIKRIEKEIVQIMNTKEVSLPHSDTIKTMEKEIKEGSAKKKENRVLQDVIEEAVGDQTEVIKVRKRCRYFN